MSPDKIAEIRGWLVKADDDLRGAEIVEAFALASDAVEEIRRRLPAAPA